MSATVDKSTSYVEIGRIAKGGLGVVEMVLRREGDFERVYAMKRPHAHLLGDDNIRRMFLQEARLAGLLQHPNVVGVLDVGEDERGPFLLMDYVEGLSLQEVANLDHLLSFEWRGGCWKVYRRRRLLAERRFLPYEH